MGCDPPPLAVEHKLALCVHTYVCVLARVAVKLDVV